jgi:ABC-type nitrate/sulfonate/bicarbonate transport system permease component
MSDTVVGHDADKVQNESVGPEQQRVTRNTPRGRERVGRWLLPIMGLLMVGVIWECTALFIVRNELFLAPLTDTLAALWELFQTGEVYPHLLASAQAFALGYVIAGFAGIAIGACFAAMPAVGRLFSWVVQGAYATPLIAIAPLLIVLFGLGIMSKVLVVFILSLFPILISTETSLRSVSPDFIETAKAFGADRWQIVRAVVFPAASVGILTGLRLAVARGIIGVVVGEIFGATQGLGFLIVRYSQSFRTARTLAVVLVLALIGVVANNLLLRLEREVSPWKQRPDRKSNVGKPNA